MPTLSRLTSCLVVFALLGAIGSVTSTGVAAEDDRTTWTVQPASEDDSGTRPYFVFDLEPGTSITDTATVTNLSETPLSLTVFGTDALNTSDGRFDLLETTSDPEDVGAWTVLETADGDADASGIAVQPGESIDVDFRIDVPQNATPGDHVGGIVTSLLTEQTGDDGEVFQLDSRVAARVYLHVLGDLEPRLQIEDLRADYDGSFTNPFSGDLTVNWTVVNDGNIRLGGQQTVAVGGFLGWGSTEHTVDLPEILPGNRVEQSVVLEGVPSAVRLGTDVEIQPIDPASRLADPIEPVRAGLQTWTVPWLLVIAAALAGVAAWAVLRSRRRQAALVDSLREELRQSHDPDPSP